MKHYFAKCVGKKVLIVYLYHGLETYDQVEGTVIALTGISPRRRNPEEAL